MPIDDRTSNLNLPKPNAANLLSDDVVRLRSALDGIDGAIVMRQTTSEKNAANGYAGLDENAKIPALLLPSFVDDVVEYTNFAQLPVTGEAGKIYVLATPHTVGGITSSQFRWSGTGYAPVSASPGTTDAIPEGSINKFFTEQRARDAQHIASSALAGLVKIGENILVAGDGTISVPTSAPFTEVFLVPAENGQTNFVVAGGYEPGRIQVIVNGIEMLGAGDDYTATDGLNIVFSVGLQTTDKILVRRWARLIGEVLSSVFPHTPINTSPLAGSEVSTKTPTFSGGAFYVDSVDVSHAETQIQVSESALFSATVYDSGSLGPVTSHTIPDGIIQTSKTYYWRMRYRTSAGVWSEWSAVTSFTTPVAFNSYIPVPEPTPNAGAAFQGGFYAGGMIWNELVQSTSSVTISTGEKTFAVADMTSAPIVYEGQMLDVRSRSNTNNSMRGTVVSAAGTQLKINVETISGSGTFSDWSIHVRYRLIVAPKSTETSSLAQANGIGIQQSYSEGFRSTLAKTTLDAKYCSDLQVNDYTDWYLPSIDELEVAYRYLKPTTVDNTTGGRSGFDMTGGGVGDFVPAFEAPNGTNLNSFPAGLAYTTSSPAQTGVTIFMTGGSESFSGSNYSSSTDQDALDRAVQHFGSGTQSMLAESNSAKVRAFRRSII